jgi:FlaA1/EpsC-like NDP-sugar epimerase
VVPLFQQQLRMNKPLTVTHPDMTRFFMTTCEAVSLVLQAFSVGKNGDILVLDMGEPISILRMAKTLISLSGHSESEVPIIFTGLRPGEKLYEELFYHFEQRLRTECEKVFRTQGKMFKWVDLDAKLRRLEIMLDDVNDDKLKQVMAAIVPEYEARLSNYAATLPPLAEVNSRSSSQRA